MLSLYRYWQKRKLLKEAKHYIYSAEDDIPVSPEMVSLLWRAFYTQKDRDLLLEPLLPVTLTLYHTPTELVDVLNTIADNVESDDDLPIANFRKAAYPETVNGWFWDKDGKRIWIPDYLEDLNRAINHCLEKLSFSKDAQPSHIYDYRLRLAYFAFSDVLTLSEAVIKKSL